MRQITTVSQHRFIGIKAKILNITVDYIHEYCSLNGLCSTLIGNDNEFCYLETFMITWKVVFPCIKSNATVTYHFEQLLIVKSL